MSSSGSPKATLDAAFKEVSQGLKGSTVERIEGLTAMIQQLNTRAEEEHQARLQQQERHEKETIGSLSARVRPTFPSRAFFGRIPIEERLHSVPPAHSANFPGWDLCDNCGSPDHKMDHCLKVHEGVLHGCILCNHQGHDTDECAVFTTMPFKDKVQLLVFQRGHMPALRTKKPWVEWLREWSARPESREEDGSFVMPARFPWGKDFTIRLACQSHGRDCDALQKEYDQHKDVTQLPQDPATANCDAVILTYGQADQSAPVHEFGEPSGEAPSIGSGIHGLFNFDEDMDTSEL